MEAVETFEHAGLTVKIYQDQDAESPASWDCLGELVAFPSLSRRYTFAERESTSTEDEAMDRRGFWLLNRYLSITEGKISVPFVLFDNWAPSIDPARFDSPSIDGFISTTHERVTELCGDDPKYHDHSWIIDALRGELEVWNQYTEGDVYGFVLERDGEHVGSLWGCYGLDYVREEARGAAEHAQRWEAEQVEKIARMMAL